MPQSLLRPRRAAGAALAALTSLALLTGCHTPDTQIDGEPLPPTSNAPEPDVVPENDSGLFINAMPEVERGTGEACPYLDTQFVAEKNGQRVMDEGVDKRFDTPACVFWSYEDAPQLQVIVRTTSSETEARSVVEWAAPVEFTDPAEEPAGWSGGRAGDGAVPGSDGAIYAVSKGETAVVVFTDQAESVKAQEIAEETIKNLGL